MFITGVSEGIGLGLTREFLRRGSSVFGTCRHAPELGKNDLFHFVPCDLSRDKEIPAAMKRLLHGVDHLDLVILNAAILGPFGDLVTQSLDEMQRVMQVNLWANKILLDILFSTPLRISQVVAVSSSAAVNLQRGWGGYALSKAALNALTMLAAREHPDTHFCALAPGPVDTSMQDQLCSHPADPKYPSLERLRAKRGTSDMPDSDEYAPHFIDALERLPSLVSSGSYADMRTLPGGTADRSPGASSG